MLGACASVRQDGTGAQEQCQGKTGQGRASRQGGVGRAVAATTCCGCNSSTLTIILCPGFVRHPRSACVNTAPITDGMTHNHIRFDQAYPEPRYMNTLSMHVVFAALQHVTLCAGSKQAPSMISLSASLTCSACHHVRQSHAVRSFLHQHPLPPFVPTCPADLQCCAAKRRGSSGPLSGNSQGLGVQVAVSSSSCLVVGEPSGCVLSWPVQHSRSWITGGGRECRCCRTLWTSPAAHAQGGRTGRGRVGGWVGG